MLEKNTTVIQLNQDTVNKYFPQFISIISLFYHINHILITLTSIAVTVIARRESIQYKHFCCS